MLRADLLTGHDVLLASAAPGDHARATAHRLAALGATVRRRVLDAFGEEPEPEPARELVWDGAGSFAAHGGADGVRAALDGAWLAIRTAIDAEAGGQKIVLVAPPPGDAHAAAVRAGLENLARVLSIEWSRFGIRIVAILPGAPEEAGELAAYLLSPAGDYFSGTALSLAGPGDLDGVLGG